MVINTQISFPSPRPSQRMPLPPSSPLLFLLHSPLNSVSAACVTMGSPAAAALPKRNLSPSVTNSSSARDRATLAPPPSPTDLLDLVPACAASHRGYALVRTMAVQCPANNISHLLFLLYPRSCIVSTLSPNMLPESCVVNQKLFRPTVAYY